MAPRLGYPATCGIFPEQGRQLCLLRQQTASLPLRREGSPGSLLTFGQLARSEQILHF